LTSASEFEFSRALLEVAEDGEVGVVVVVPVAGHGVAVVPVQVEVVDADLASSRSPSPGVRLLPVKPLFAYFGYILTSDGAPPAVN
jgi:hypothetical protein